ncbi:MAG: TIGR02147 family protein [Bdellovibrionaceae bacterium]|nr:TIGR02147 family protein [Pseudobdellovibrionaceae bacterium]
MMKESPIEIFQAALKKKQGKQSKFSLRQLATRAEVSAPFLSQVMNGKRALPLSLAVKLCRILDVQKEKRDYILSMLLEGKGVHVKVPLSDRKDIDKASKKKTGWNFVPDRSFWALSEWYYLPILNCTLLEGYDGSPEFIAQKLDLPLSTVKAALARLKDGHLLELQEGKLVKSNAMNDFHSAAPRAEIRRFHASGMDRAQVALREKITDGDLERRLITSMVLTVAESDIPWLKQQIIELMNRCSTHSQKSTAEKVYHLGIQFFPHST